MTAGHPAILAEGLRKSYGNTQALNGLNLLVEEGTILGLLGPNGAGKSTVVRILTTLLNPDAGEAKVAGLDVVRQADKLRSRIGLAGQYAAVDETLTGRENLEMFGRLYHSSGRRARSKSDDLLERFGLTDAASRLVKTYSGGMRRRLDLAVSLVSSPQVLFLDEPTTGLDPASRLAMWEVITELAAGGTTLLLTTQYLEEADRSADRIAIVDGGRIIAEGTPDELKSKVGGKRLQVTLTKDGDLDAAARVLEYLGVTRARIETNLLRVVAPATRGTALLAAVLREFDAAGIEIEDFGLRRPTLDDVFLALTGRTARRSTSEGTLGRKQADTNLDKERS